jgi:hypothetical protein
MKRPKIQVFCTNLFASCGGRRWITVKQKLKLEENIAAVRFTEFSAGNDVKGVAVTIPAGEIVDLDRQAPVVGHMREIEWKGSRYGVFPDDLLERTDKLQADRSAATSNR